MARNPVFQIRFLPAGKKRISLICQEFGIYGTGETLPEAVSDFCVALLADYHAYAEADDRTLDTLALVLARRYREIAKVEDESQKAGMDAGTDRSGDDDVRGEAGDAGD